MTYVGHRGYSIKRNSQKREVEREEKSNDRRKQSFPEWKNILSR
jgi:hypothetical protein